MQPTFPAAAARRTPWLWLLPALLCGAALCLLYLAVQTVWGARNLRYEVTSTDVVITFSWQQTVIPRSEIRSVTHVTATRGSRLNGTSLPGLQEGRWRFPETGEIRMYSRSTSPLTVIETAHEKWGISPADPAAFAAVLRNGQTGVFPPVTVARANWTWFYLLSGLGVVIALGLAGLVIHMLRAAPRTAYTLEDTGLRIRLGWTNRLLPYARIADVRSASPAGYPMRLLGTALPGLYWGSFAWQGVGRRVRLYATRLRPLVLVEADGITYGISPADDAGFVQELQARLPR